MSVEAKILINQPVSGHCNDLKHLQIRLVKKSITVQLIYSGFCSGSFTATSRAI